MTVRVAALRGRYRCGDWQWSRTSVLQGAHHAAAHGADLLVTPECWIGGYGVKDLWYDTSFIERAAHECRTIAEELDGAGLGHLRVWIGSPWPTNELTTRLDQQPDDGLAGRIAANCLIEAHHGTTTVIAVKRALPSYAVFDETRWFVPGNGNDPTVDINGHTVGGGICADVWSQPCVDDWATAGCELVAVANGSAHHVGKQRDRIEHLQHVSDTHRLAIWYVNAEGSIDECTFDGGTIATGPGVDATAQRPFSGRRQHNDPNSIWTDIADWTGDQWQPVSDHWHTTNRHDDTSDDTNNDTVTEERYRSLTVALSDYICDTGLDTVIIGVSGGIDSAVAATVAVDAVGADHVIGVAMPSRWSSPGSISDAVEVAERCGFELRTIPIDDIVDTLHTNLTGPGNITVAGTTAENLQARARGILLMGIANAVGGIVIATGNRTETALGYTTLYGDMCGGYAPLGDCTKQHVRDIARWRNRHQPWPNTPNTPIPDTSINKPPSAELADAQRDEDVLGPYPYCDLVVTHLVEHRSTRNQIVTALTSEHPDAGDIVGNPATWVDQMLRRIEQAEHKRRQGPPVARVAPGTFTVDRATARNTSWWRDAAPPHRPRTSNPGTQPTRPDDTTATPNTARDTTPEPIAETAPA